MVEYTRIVHPHAVRTVTNHTIRGTDDRFLSSVETNQLFAKWVAFPTRSQWAAPRTNG